MKKTERIQQELFFLHGKKQFNLKDLMNEFNISKRTALRDLQALENLGLPVYSESGRWGGYRLLDNTLLPPIYFTESEIFAIFYSLQTLNLLKESPFGRSYSSLKDKLLNMFSSDKKERIVQMLDALHYEGVEQIASTNNLEELFSHIVKNDIIEMTYTRYGKQDKLILPTRLTMMDGYWYCSALDVHKQAWRTYRCDYIEHIRIKESYQTSYSLDYLKQSYLDQQAEQRTIPFKVKVSEIGKEQFLKRHFSNMAMEVINNDIFIVGHFHENELNFLVNYFFSLGEHAEILEPTILKEAYIETLRRLLGKY